MTDNQLEIGDALLKYLAANGGEANKDQYPLYLSDTGYNKKEWLSVLELLVNLKLIEKFAEDDYRIMLTAKGWKASKNLKKYLRCEELKEKLKIALPIIAVIVAILTFLFTFIVK